MFTPIGFYGSSSGSGGMTSAFYVADVWNLTDVNTTIGAYSKNNGANELGKYQRGAGVYYSSEVLCKSTAMETAISGKTIDSFYVEYTVSVNNMVADLSTAGCNVSVMNCNVAWTDTPSTQPRFNVPFGETTPWPAALVIDSTIWKKTTTPVYSTPTGVYSIATSTAQNTVIQDWANGNNKNGLVLSMDPKYYISTITVSGVRFWVQYT